MNTNINKFSPKRMLHFMAADMYNRRVTLILFFALAFLGTAVFYILNLDYAQVRMECNNLDLAYAQDLKMQYLFANVTFAMTFTCIIYLSMVFTPFFKRGYAAQNIMIPASRSEKFFSRILDVVIVSAVIYAICWALSAIYGAYIGATLGFAPFYEVAMEDGQLSLVLQSTGKIITKLSGILLIISIYFFGATLWRKLHFIKTSATLLGIFILGALFELFVVDIVLDTLFSDEVWVWVTSLLSLGFFGMAWLRFRNIQIRG